MIATVGGALLAAAAAPLARCQAPRDDTRALAAFERQLLLQRALLAADADVCARALGHLEVLRQSDVPSAYAPPFDVLARAWHEVAGDPPSSGPPQLQRLVDALDLRCVPGAFTAAEAQSGARGTPITVHVAPLYAIALPEEPFELVLTWRGPLDEGRSARRETIDARAVLPAGFEMYVHAPVSAAGTWWLVPSIAHPTGDVRGMPVPVECVEDLEARLLERESDDPRAGWVARSLLQTGRRDPRGPGLGALLAGASPDLVPPFSVAGLDPAGHVLVALEPEESASLRATLIAVAPVHEQADWLFAGAALERWRAFVESEGVRVLSTDLPCAADEGPSVTALAAALRARAPAEELILLVRGPAVAELAMALRAPAEPFFDACVQSSLHASDARPTALASRPTLIVDVLAETASGLERIPGAAGEDVQRTRLVGPPLWADLELPAAIAAWLRSRATPRGADGR